MSEEQHSKYATEFWAGYRAFVLGGRRISCSGRGGKVKVLDPSQEPYGHFNEEQRKQWLRGINYAKRERKECRAIPPDGNSSSTFRSSRQTLVRLLQRGLKTSQIAEELGVTIQSVNAWKRRLAEEP